jgi:hypothetical protein
LIAAKITCGEKLLLAAEVRLVQIGFGARRAAAKPGDRVKKHKNSYHLLPVCL